MLRKWYNPFDIMEDANLLERSRQVSVIMLHRYHPASWMTYNLRRISRELHYLLDGVCTWDDWNNDYVYSGREDICCGNGISWNYYPKDKPLWMYCGKPMEEPTDMPILEGQYLNRIISSLVSLVLRGANDYFLEVERSLHDALCIVKRTLEPNAVTYVVKGSERVQVVVIDWKWVLDTKMSGGSYIMVPRFCCVKHC